MCVFILRDQAANVNRKLKKSSKKSWHAKRAAWEEILLRQPQVLLMTGIV